MARIGERVLEQDDLLHTAWSVRGSEETAATVFDRFADACLAQLFLELEFRHVVGELDTDEFLLETARLITQCRTVGLEPPVSLDELDLDEFDDRPLGRYQPPSFD